MPPLKIKKKYKHVKVTREIHYLLKIVAAYRKTSITQLVNAIFNDFYEKEKNAVLNKVISENEKNSEKRITDNKPQFLEKTEEKLTPQSQ